MKLAWRCSCARTLTVSGAAIKKHSVMPASAPDAYRLYQCPCGTIFLYSSFAVNLTACKMCVSDE